jgi:hypothetical protein
VSSQLRTHKGLDGLSSGVFLANELLEHGPAAEPGILRCHDRVATNGLPAGNVFAAATCASKLEDAGGACCDDDDAAERGSDEQGDAEWDLPVEGQEGDGHPLKVLQDENKHEHQRCHQDDHSRPHRARARPPHAAFGRRSPRDFGRRL